MAWVSPWQQVRIYTQPRVEHITHWCRLCGYDARPSHWETTPKGREAWTERPSKLCALCRPIVEKFRRLLVKDTAMLMLCKTSLLAKRPVEVSLQAMQPRQERRSPQLNPQITWADYDAAEHYTGYVTEEKEAVREYARWKYGGNGNELDG